MVYGWANSKYNGIFIHHCHWELSNFHALLTKHTLTNPYIQIERNTFKTYKIYIEIIICNNFWNIHVCVIFKRIQHGKGHHKTDLCLWCPVSDWIIAIGFQYLYRAQTSVIVWNLHTNKRSELQVKVSHEFKFNIWFIQQDNGLTIARVLNWQKVWTSASVG